MKLNVSGIKIPTREVNVEVLDQQLEVTIYPIAGFGLAKLQKLTEQLHKDENNYEVQEKLVKDALQLGCKSDEETINFLIENDMFACMKLVQQIMNFSAEYNNKKIDQASIAKKKLKK